MKSLCALAIALLPLSSFAQAAHDGHGLMTCGPKGYVVSFELHRSGEMVAGSTGRKVLNTEIVSVRDETFPVAPVTDSADNSVSEEIDIDDMEDYTERWNLTRNPVRGSVFSFRPVENPDGSLTLSGNLALFADSGREQSPSHNSFGFSTKVFVGEPSYHLFGESSENHLSVLFKCAP